MNSISLIQCFCLLNQLQRTFSYAKRFLWILGGNEIQYFTRGLHYIYPFWSHYNIAWMGHFQRNSEKYGENRISIRGFVLHISIYAKYCQICLSNLHDVTYWPAVQDKIIEKQLNLNVLKTKMVVYIKTYCFKISNISHAIENLGNS